MFLIEQEKKIISLQDGFCYVSCTGVEEGKTLGGCVRGPRACVLVSAPASGGCFRELPKKPRPLGAFCPCCSRRVSSLQVTARPAPAGRSNLELAPDSTSPRGTARPMETAKVWAEAFFFLLLRQKGDFHFTWRSLHPAGKVAALQPKCSQLPPASRMFHSEQASKCLCSDPAA